MDEEGRGVMDGICTDGRDFIYMGMAPWVQMAGWVLLLYAIGLLRKVRPHPSPRSPSPRFELRTCAALQSRYGSRGVLVTLTRPHLIPPYRCTMAD